MGRDGPHIGCEYRIGREVGRIEVWLLGLLGLGLCI